MGQYLAGNFDKKFLKGLFDSLVGCLGDVFEVIFCTEKSVVIAVVFLDV